MEVDFVSTFINNGLTLADAPMDPIAWIPGYASVPDGMTVIGENRSDLLPRLMPMSCRY